MKKILPGDTIGIIGGGQLGKMIALAAKYNGYKIAVLEPLPDSPTESVADISLIATYDDMNAYKKLGEISDVVTYEFENIPFNSIREAVDQNLFYLPQGHKPLEICQHRLREKKAIERAGCKVAPYQKIFSKEDILSFGEKYQYPFIIKTCELGYDGKGQVMIQSKKEATSQEVIQHITKQECIAEKVVSFSKELSVIVFRDLDGKMETLSTFENIHHNGILQQTISPARVSKSISDKALEMAKKMTANLGLYGTLSIEMFLLDNEILINEMAPRPHNSGHSSIEGASYSQFEQHLRSICGIPLGKNSNYGFSSMVNILGEHYDKSIQFFQEKKNLNNTYFHFYGKSEARKGRKMGHVTFIDTDIQSLEKKSNEFLDKVIRPANQE